MPAGRSYHFLPKAELLSFEEITRLVRLFVALGVDRVRLTGGEPLLRSELERLVAMLAEVPGLNDLALTTNGFLLAEKAQALHAAGLRRVTVSLESLDPQTFARANGVGASLAKVLAGIDEAERVGLGPIKINSVVMRGVNDHEVVDLARFFKERGHTLRFIEYMDVGTLNEWQPDAVLSAREIMARVAVELPLEPVARRESSDPALRFRYLDGEGEIGAIASITEPFCGDCSRARLSSEGQLLTCLFAHGGVDLKTPLRSGRSDEALSELVREAWRQREDRYSEERAELIALGRWREQPRVEMFRIGG
jgi:cyclic pyranopterin phosphate synthase